MQPRASTMQINEFITQRGAHRIIQVRPLYGGGGTATTGPLAGHSRRGWDQGPKAKEPGRGSWSRCVRGKGLSMEAPLGQRGSWPPATGPAPLGDFSRALCSPQSPIWSHTLKSNSGPGEAGAVPTCKRGLPSPFWAPRSLPWRVGPAPVTSPSAPAASCSQVGAPATPGSWINYPCRAGTRGQVSPYLWPPFPGFSFPEVGGAGT